jgi:predicted adenylyl cyclase CyaB
MHDSFTQLPHATGSPLPPRENIELKARLGSIAPARAAAQRVATSQLPDQRQTDTYFHCPHGRLKLREIEGQQAQLIWYQRPDERQAKHSSYVLVPILDPAPAKQALDAALGIRAVVQKHREIYLHDNVRIHLDRVERLGTFLEFEAVLGLDVDAATARAQVERLRAQFDIADDDLITISYGEMLAGMAKSPRAE